MTVAALERKLALMNKLTRPFRDRGDEKAAALLKQINSQRPFAETDLSRRSKYIDGRERGPGWQHDARHRRLAGSTVVSASAVSAWIASRINRSVVCSK